MMSFLEQARMKALEKKCEELEARLAIVERADSYENSAAIVPRRRGRPARKVEPEAPSAA
jgi:hypothetical protein